LAGFPERSSLWVMGAPIREMSANIHSAAGHVGYYKPENISSTSEEKRPDADFWLPLGEWSGE